MNLRAMPKGSTIAGPRLDIDVEGTPVPQGSMSRTPAGGMRHSSRDLEAWRDAIGWTAIAAARRSGMSLPLFARQEPVRVSVTFRLPRPASVRRWWPSVPPDGDKLLRAVFDALTAARILTDDAQVVRGTFTKVYGKPGARIVVRRCGGEEALA